MFSTSIFTDPFPQVLSRDVVLFPTTLKFYPDSSYKFYHALHHFWGKLLRCSISMWAKSDRSYMLLTCCFRWTSCCFISSYILWDSAASFKSWKRNKWETIQILFSNWPLWPDGTTKKNSKINFIVPLRDTKIEAKYQFTLAIAMYTLPIFTFLKHIINHSFIVIRNNSPNLTLKFTRCYTIYCLIGTNMFSLKDLFNNNGHHNKWVFCSIRPACRNSNMTPWWQHL